MVPQNGWFIRENPIGIDDLGGNTPIFGSTPRYLKGFPSSPHDLKSLCITASVIFFSFLKRRNFSSETNPRGRIKIWVVVSNILYFHPYLGKISHLTNIFQMGWNHQLEIDVAMCRLTFFANRIFCCSWSEKNTFTLTQIFVRVRMCVSGLNVFLLLNQILWSHNFLNRSKTGYICLNRMQATIHINRIEVWKNYSFGTRHLFFF